MAVLPVSSGAPFPHDLPDLLRLACGQGKMRFNVWFGKTERGREYQANLADSGDGWSVEYHRDPLEAMAKVLRVRFGNMLERERAKLASDDSDCFLKHHLPDGGKPFCDCEEREGDHSGCVDGDDIRDAIRFVSVRLQMDDAFANAFANAVLDALYGKDAQPNLHAVDMTTAGAAPAAEVDEFSALADDFEALL